jgi:RNA polymerase sigma-70 factor (ECF subfamily)
MMDEKAAREFVQRLTAGQRRLYAFIRSQVYSRNDADEVLQQTTAVLWEKYESFRPNGDFVRWACGIARLEVLAHCRNRRRLRVLFDENVADAVGDRLAAAADEVDLRLDMLVQCMKELMLRDRDLIERHYRNEQSVMEIAAALGVSESSVYKRLGHSRDMLYECIQRRLAERKQS